MWPILLIPSPNEWAVRIIIQNFAKTVSIWDVVRIWDTPFDLFLWNFLKTCVQRTYNVAASQSLHPPILVQLIQQNLWIVVVFLPSAKLFFNHLTLRQETNPHITTILSTYLFLALKIINEFSSTAIFIFLFISRRKRVVVHSENFTRGTLGFYLNNSALQNRILELYCDCF